MFNCLDIYKDIEKELSSYQLEGVQRTTDSDDVPQSAYRIHEDTSLDTVAIGDLYPTQLWELIEDVSNRAHQFISLKKKKNKKNKNKNMELSKMISNDEYSESEDHKEKEKEKDNCIEENSINKSIESVEHLTDSDSESHATDVNININKSNGIKTNVDFFDSGEMKSWLKDGDAFERKIKKRINSNSEFGTINNNNKEDDSEESSYDLLNALSETEPEAARYEDFFGENGVEQLTDIKKNKDKSKDKEKEKDKDKEYQFEDEDEDDEHLDLILNSYAEEMSIDLSVKGKEIEEDSDGTETSSDIRKIKTINKNKNKNEYYNSDSEDEEDKNIEDTNSINFINKNNYIPSYLEKMNDEISRLEMQQVGKKDWTMLGEVTASSRPYNSILDQHLDLPFGFARELIPSSNSHEDIDSLMNEDGGGESLDHKITKSQKIEELIVNRIKNNLFDNVQERSGIILEKDNKNKNKKEEKELRFEKSKIGLAEDYAQEYEEKVLGVKTAIEKKGEQKKADLRELFRKLLYRLDSMCNQTFIPKPKHSDKTRKRETPAYLLEEAVPITLTDKDNQKNQNGQWEDRKVITTEFTPQQKKTLRRKIKRRYEQNKSKGKGRIHKEGRNTKD